MTAGRRLVGRLGVPLAPAEAFDLFTPLGEREWIHGWEPHFPHGAHDDTEPGTVFETEAHGARTTWVVVARDRPRRISYARVAPGDRAGTVTVRVEPAGGFAEVEVEYALTALAPSSEAALAEFADGYAAYLTEWERAIAECVALRG